MVDPAAAKVTGAGFSGCISGSNIVGNTFIMPHAISVVFSPVAEE